MSNLLRVTQMNAVFLDKEIYRTLIQILQDASKSLPPGFTASFEPEIGLLLHLAILSNSICKSGSTFGQQLLSIKYESISSTQKTLYTLSACLDYVKNRLELWRPSHDVTRRIFNIHMILVLLNFVNISIFLRGGSKPQLIERLLGLRQVYTTENAPRHFASKYLARELVWNGFIEILVHVLPLINYHKIKRTMRHYNPFHKKPNFVMKSQVITMHSKCAHCGLNPVLPHHMGCAHIFCYVCLQGNQTADSRFECPICEHRNPNVLCDRVSVM